MPPRAGQGQNSFSVSDDPNQVVCPLGSQDGTPCRKRCLGDKRYRSIQEHIRRAHPNHYIPKLPATQESFQLMINTPPSARPAAPPPASSSSPAAAAAAGSGGRAPRDHKSILGIDPDARSQGYGSPAPQGRGGPPLEEYPTTATTATAAMALAQLHSQRDSDWGGSEADMSDHDAMRPSTNHSYDLPPLKSQLPHESFGGFPSGSGSGGGGGGGGGGGSASGGGVGGRPRELLPSVLSRSPPGRSSTLPPLQRPNRPRKESLTQSARRPRHERQRSRDLNHRRLSIEGRKASSAEPSLAMINAYKSKRWEDLIEAATSATEADSDRDLTPIPQSPPQVKRASLPPFAGSSGGSGGSGFAPHHAAGEHYKASPLQRALTPPPADDPAHPATAPSSAERGSYGGYGAHLGPSSAERYAPYGGPSPHAPPPPYHQPPSFPGPGAAAGPSDPRATEPFPSVEGPGGGPDSSAPGSADPLHRAPSHSAHSSGGAGGSSGVLFHMRPSGLSAGESDAASPTFAAARAARAAQAQAQAQHGYGSGGGTGAVEIVCAHCRAAWPLLDSYACAACIRGFCADCVYVLSSEPRDGGGGGGGGEGGGGGGTGRACPRCGAVGVRFLPVQLELRR